MNKYSKLKTLDAWGAIEDDDVEKVNEGYEMFEHFRAGRNLKRVPLTMEMIPWLFKARFYSKMWEENYAVRVPFRDHVRYFVNKGTKERTATIQPYLLTVAQKEDGDSTPLRLPDEFTQLLCDCVNARPLFRPLPDLPVVKETISAILDKAKKVSDEFASKHGLRASVSFDGWYNPQQTILIEYRRAA
jgi:hypothetical protein